MVKFGKVKVWYYKMDDEERLYRYRVFSRLSMIISINKEINRLRRNKYDMYFKRKVDALENTKNNLIENFP